MSFVVESIVTAAIGALFEKLASTDLPQFARQEQIHADLKKWKKTLVKIQAVVDDAEEKQVTNERVKIWLSELKNLVYDVEDMLDEFATEGLRRRLLNESQASTSKVRKFIPTCCTGLNPKSVKFNAMMASQVEEITARLQEIVAQKNDLGLTESSGRRSEKGRDRRLLSTSLSEPHVYGREKEKEAILEFLLKDAGKDDRISVLPIVGMGGLGKTALAQLVYNDVKVEDHFDLKAWTCVSEDFDVVRITKTILQFFDIGNKDVNDLSRLQVELKQNLSGKKFFMVLDDVWNENYDDWTILCRPFEAGSAGSKIIVTTRNYDVSSMVGGNIPAYRLEKLSNEDCLSIFTRHSLEKKDFSQHPDLREIGEKIVKRCSGLPLAAKTLGGLLRGKYNYVDWEHVLNNKLWNLPEEKSGIMPALRLSYHYLPSHLKRCFVYCSILPKDYEFGKEELVVLWMAEGLLQNESTGKQMEDLGFRYFQELYSRSFFQQSSTNVTRFVMHDLINDLAQSVAGDLALNIENTNDGDQKWKIYENLRHLSYIASEYDGINKFKAVYGISDVRHLTYKGGIRDHGKLLEPFNNVKQLRTFLPIHRSWYNHNLTYDVINTLPKLKRLRVLSLKGYRIFELPNSVGDLKHLRQLDLSHTDIKILPDSINTLYNLQTLLLNNCVGLRKLCADMGNLINLQYLNNSGVPHLEGMPLRIGRLTRLLMLPKFVVDEGIGSGLAELKSLINLRESFKISRLEKVNDVEDAKEANLNEKRDLNEIFLEWTNTPVNSRKPEHETLVLDVLKPHQKLEKLTISGCGGMKFPTWLGDGSFSKLVFLKLQNCSNCASLPSVGQLPLLKHLVIRRMARVEIVGPEIYGDGQLRPFLSLETLSFEFMREWKDWSCNDIYEFPCLRQLSIIQCPKLTGKLPQHLNLLEKLVINNCGEFVVSIQSLPRHCSVEIDGCKEVVWRSRVDGSSLNSVVISNISSYMFLAEPYTQGLAKDDELEIVGYKDATSYWCVRTQIKLLQDMFYRCSLVHEHFWSFVSMVKKRQEELKQQGSTCRPQYLALLDSENPLKLTYAFQSLGFLVGLTIKDCPKLVSFPETVMPPLLKFIDIENCDALECLPETWMHNSVTSLECLSVQSCASLTYIAKVQIPSNLNRLVIDSCTNLSTVIDEEGVSIIDEENIKNTSLLEYLDIRNCQSLVSLWSKKELPAALQEIAIGHCPKLASVSSCGYLPKALKRLRIWRCSKLEFLAEWFKNSTSIEEIDISECENFKLLPKDLHKLSHLRKIYVSECPNFVSFPEEGLPSTKLTALRVSGCGKMEVLPNCFRKLTSLRDVVIENCPDITFSPEDGFPPNVTQLCKKNVGISKPFCEWGLSRLTSLKHLTIGGCEDVVHFPQEKMGMNLPTSLTFLSIGNFPQLEYLSSIVHNLHSLESLHLNDCPNLKYFPEKGLPLSLLELCIGNCPLLEERCKKYEGQYWPMIAYIPSVEIWGQVFAL